MRLVRLPVLLVALLASVVSAPISAQNNNQKGPAAQAAGRAGQVAANDIIDRMNKSERTVIERVRTSQPLMEVYLQSVAPDEARGWVPTDDSYFLGQLRLEDKPALRPFGEPEQRGVKLRLISDKPDVGNAFAAMVAPDWQVLDRKRYEFTYVRREFLGE
jgi:hypothetical protein